MEVELEGISLSKKSDFRSYKVGYIHRLAVENN